MSGWVALHAAHIRSLYPRRQHRRYRLAPSSWFTTMKSPHSRLLFLFPVTIKAQIIEISRDSVHVGDDVTLKCSLVDGSQDATNYVWYLNSESREKEDFIDFSLFHLNRRDLFHFPLFFRFSRFSSMRADKKVINSEHFVRRGSELTIKNALKHLSGYYSCVVEFLNSGAKLETPHELINIVGEYPWR